jgi:hypothetical protein
VSVPVWGLTPRQRAELLRIVEAGGRGQRKGIPREQLASLVEAGYLTVYDDGLVMLTRRRCARSPPRSTGAPPPGKPGRAGTPAPAQPLTAKNLTSLIEVRCAPDDG